MTSPNWSITKMHLFGTRNANVIMLLAASQAFLGVVYGAPKRNLLRASSSSNSLADMDPVLTTEEEGNVVEVHDISENRGLRHTKKAVLLCALACVGGGTLFMCNKAGLPPLGQQGSSFDTYAGEGTNLLQKNSAGGCWFDQKENIWSCKKHYMPHTFRYMWGSKPKLCLANGGGETGGLLHGKVLGMVRKFDDDCDPDTQLVENIESGWRLVSVGGNDQQFIITRDDVPSSVLSPVELVFKGLKLRDDCVEIADPVDTCAMLKKVCDNPQSGMEKTMDKYWCLAYIDGESYTQERLYRAIMNENGATLQFQNKHLDNGAGILAETSRPTPPIKISGLPR